MSESLEQVDYEMPKLGKVKWTVWTVALFLAAFVMYYPLASKVENQIRSSLVSMPGCPIAYNSMSFEFFLPKLVVTDLNLPASCFNQRGEGIALDKVFLHFRGLSFSPFGPHFKLETSVMGQPLEALISGGVGGLSLALENSVIDLVKISPLLPAGLKLGGKAKVNLLAKAGEDGLKELNLLLASKNFVLPPQSIQAFSLKRMDINNLLLKAKTSAPGPLKIEEFILGDAQAPVRAKFSGTVKLNQNMPAASRLNLKGEVAFSKDFLDDYAVVGMLMNQFDKKDDFYQIQIKGTLAQPVPSSPGK